VSVSEIADAIGGTVADMFGGDSPVAETEDTAVAVAAQEAEVAPEAAAPVEAWDFEAAGRDLFVDDPEKIAAERAALKTQAIAEARQEAEAAWGRPSVGGQNLGVPATPAQGEQGRLDDAIRRRDMYGATKAMIDAGII
jgi:hypothetical protein